MRSPQSPTIALYPGTFDPITNGHLDIITRALSLFDKVVVTLATNSSKKPLFSLEERIDLISECFPDQQERLEITASSGLLVDFARDKKACAIIRGLRAVSDFDYEFQLALINRKLGRDVETIFLMPGFRWIYISSSIIKEAASHHGDVSELVPPHVNSALITKFSK